MDNSYHSYSGSDTSPTMSEQSSYHNSKRQRTSDDTPQPPSNNSNPSDFLNFDYGFPLDPTAIASQENPTVATTTTNTSASAIPEDFFMFVTDPSAAAPATTSNLSPAPSTSEPMKQQDPPNQNVYTIVVGGKPFRLSWESLKSDGPNNFFLEYFRKKKTKTMYIDRDPDIFEVIVKHLRGYYIRSTDDLHNQSLLYDATYFGLNRLKKVLQEYLYVNVGGRVFRLPWDLFKKDGTHNFFTGPLMHSFLTPHTSADNSPPIYIDRDPDIFEDIINHLRGYTIHIRDEVHRKNLLKDAQYYVFRQLSDKLLIAQQTVAGFGESSNPEVLLLLQDIRVANLLPSQAMKQDKSFTMEDPNWNITQLQYKREGPHALLVQISDICMQFHNNKSKLTFEMNESDMKKMRTIANIVKATDGVNMEIFLDDYCAITIDDQQVKSIAYCIENNIIETNWEPCTKEDACQIFRFILQRAICSVHVIDNKITLCALRLEAISSRFRLNLKRQFLSVQ